MSATKSSVRQIRLGDAVSAEISGDTPIRNYTHQSRNVSEIHIRPTDQYPYPDQEILEGEFDYEQKSFLGKTSASVKFQLRRKSGLLVVQKQGGSAKLDSVVSALDEQLDLALETDVDIYDQFHHTVEGIWSFIRSSKWISSLTLRVQSEDIPFEDYAEKNNLSFSDIDSQYPISYADIVFEAPWDDPVSVVYDHGQLEIATDNDDLYEFVLQRFETDVLSN